MSNPLAFWLFVVVVLGAAWALVGSESASPITPRRARKGGVL